MKMERMKMFVAVILAVGITSVASQSLGSSLKVGEVMGPGQYITAGSGYFAMLADGNLALCAKSPTCSEEPPLWQTNTSGNPGALAMITTYGCFNVFAANASHSPSSTAERLWQTHTMTKAGCLATNDTCTTTLTISRVSNVVLSSTQTGKMIWETMTSYGGKNVLLIVVDDLRPQMNLAYGQKEMITPNLDKLANSSMVFNRAYVQFAVCNPSRNSFMTGRRPDSTMVWNFQNSFRGSGGGPGESWDSMPEHFRKMGWITVGGGKIFHPCCGLEMQDWQRSWTHGFGAGYFYFFNRGMDDSFNDPFYEGDCPDSVSLCPTQAPLENFYDNRLARHTVNALEQYVNSATRSNFFIANGFRRPHNNWLIPQQFYDMYAPTESIVTAKYQSAPKNVPPIAMNDGGFKFADCANSSLNPSKVGCVSNISHPMDEYYQKEARHGYYASVSFTDSQIGLVLDSLERLQLANDTIVCLFGDHGWQLGEHDEWHKHTNFELATRTPMFIRVPGKVTMGRRSTSFIEAVDVFATLADLAGIPLNSQQSDGRSFAALFDTLDNTHPVVEYPSSAASPPTNSFNVSFSQYPRCPMNLKSLSGDHSCDSIPRSQIQVMGYTVRTAKWRYTKWLSWNTTLLAAEFHSDARIWGEELYDHSTDTGFDMDMPSESINLAYDGMHNETKEMLFNLIYQKYYRTPLALMQRNAKIPKW
eukprot:m.205289 g.205289  ORF g.205289 m.205289 type:complete len:702 (+) comp15783_c0_seq5:81-2186(+)